MTNEKGLDPRAPTSIGEEDTDSCRTMWMAVITQQIIDARSRDKKRSAQRRRSEARAWLSNTEPESEFSETCYLADLEPEYVKERVAYFLENPEKPIDFRKTRREPTGEGAAPTSFDLCLGFAFFPNSSSMK